MARKTTSRKAREHASRRVVLRGLGVIMPPLLTIVFLLWVWNAVRTYVVDPIEGMVRHAMVARVIEVHDTRPPSGRWLDESPQTFEHEGKAFVSLASGQWVPATVYAVVRQDPGKEFPTTAYSLYERYVQIIWLRPSIVVPIFFSVFIILVYILGKFIAARVGRMMWNYFERLINHLPFIRTIYGTVKQVTDIVFNDSEIEFTRVVAVEYPRKGTWSIGFVTGESMLALQEVAQEPVLSVLMPTSPMPATGFTITVRKSETVDLNLSVDQAFQFVVSCGVVVPTMTEADDEEARIQRSIRESLQASEQLRIPDSAASAAVASESAAT